jgi:hypothetical protein
MTTRAGGLRRADGTHDLDFVRPDLLVRST